ncbi:MAG: EAL domain-containing protein [Rhizobacter sp.]|nr:EAL domain-containing protein [Rhizobacter sp.]
MDRTQELMAARQLAVTQAETDALTGIANRAAFSRRLDERLADAHATVSGVAVLLIDLDDFKAVNDNLGHPAGDALLIELAHRLADAVRPGDAVARLGGDKFAVIARDVGFRQHGLQLSNRLLNAVCRPVAFEGRNIACSCSIGLAEADPIGTRVDTLLGNADLALYAAKRAGRARVRSFEAGLWVEVEHKARLEREVREAVMADQIEPWYQPIRDCASGRIKGVELLARWHLASGEVRLPGAFLGTVESLDLLDSMMENMLRRALPEVLPLVHSGALDFLAINVSPGQFNRGWAQQALPRLQSETGFPAHALMVELTETALLDDIGRVRDMLAALTAGGMCIALDDFGVGYSNFSLLRQLPFNLLKLDRSLSCDIEADEQSRAVTECILALAARLRIDVVAEGVETQRQSELLLAAGCAAQQGFLHARPQRDLRGLVSASSHLCVEAGVATARPKP